MNERYIFTYRVGIPEHHHAHLYVVTIGNKKTVVDFTHTPSEEFDFWKKLEYNQCSNCTLDPKEHPECPIASNLLPIIQDFKEIHSWESIKVDVECNRRHYFNKTSVQDALKSLIGLIMASSSCPHFQFLKSLAKLHLPFASHEETIYRVTSSFLLREYLKNPKGKINLEGLQDCYKELTEVNKGIIARIRGLEMEDAGQNAMIDLDAFIQMFSIEYEMDLNDIYELFEMEHPQAAIAP